ncbi:alpha/beta-hydrolase [Aureobasidium pullulans]|nr:alpha/beta-hydrolase [Aureobasidium pullulans]
MILDFARSILFKADCTGPIFKLKIGAERIFVASHELAKDLFDEEKFEKAVAGPLKEIRHGVKDGLFTAQPGEHNWEIAHRILMPAFGPLSIESMFNEMADVASQLVLKCAMGDRFNSFYHDDMHPFVKAMLGLLTGAGARARRPGFAPEMLYSKSNRQFHDDIDELQTVAKQLLDERHKHPSDKKDLLNAMINGRDSKTGEQLPEEVIIRNMIAFLIVTLPQQLQTDLTPNLRGFGRSAKLPSQRGASGPTKTVLLDMTELLMTVLPSPYPVFLMGHSMGGQQVLYYGTQGPVSILQQLSGFIVEAPAIHLPDAPTGFLRLLLRYMAKMLPKFQMHAAPKPARLTRDPVRNAEIEADVLFHGYCTLEGMNGALERVDYNISAGCKRLGEATPMHEPSLFMLQGTADDVCLLSGAEEYFKKCPLKDKELKLYEGWLHELHGEVGEDKLTFARDVTYWILSHSK